MLYEEGKIYRKGKTLIEIIEYLESGVAIVASINGLKVFIELSELQGAVLTDKKSYMYTMELTVNVSNPNPGDIRSFLEDRLEKILYERSLVTGRSEVLMSLDLKGGELNHE